MRRLRVVQQWMHATTSQKKNFSGRWSPNPTSAIGRSCEEGLLNNVWTAYLALKKTPKMLQYMPQRSSFATYFARRRRPRYPISWRLLKQQCKSTVEAQTVSYTRPLPRKRPQPRKGQALDPRLLAWLLPDSRVESLSKGTLIDTVADLR